MEFDNMNSEMNEQEVTAQPSDFVDSPCEKEIPKKESKNKSPKVLTTVLTIMTVVALGVSAVSIMAVVKLSDRVALLNKVNENKMNVSQQQVDISGSTENEEDAPADTLAPGQVYANNVKAVVAISNQALSTNLFGQVSETASSGSGFIISQDGYVVTNYHVVSGATTLKVITWDTKEYVATLIGGDATNDIAVLKIEGSDFPYVKLGSSEKMAVGDRVAAIGNPLGELTSTLTVGYISATDRAVNTDGTYINMLQTDAAINSGNSGGPLFNMHGEVIGITTAKYSGTSNSGATIEGIGFAIPIDDVTGIISDLKDKGYISGAYLGVMVQDVNAEAAEMYGVPTGAYVVEVTEGNCAEKAGIQPKDIITNIGGYDVSSMSDLTRALRNLEPGQETTVTVYRGGQQVHMEITLDEKPKPDTNSQAEPEKETQDNQEQKPGTNPFENFGG